MNLSKQDDGIEFIRLERVSEETAMKEEDGEEKHEWGDGRGSG